MYGINHVTLGSRIHGKRSRKDANHAMQRLSPAEEDSLQDWVLQLESWGHPVTNASGQCRTTNTLLTRIVDTGEKGISVRKEGIYLASAQTISHDISPDLRLLRIRTVTVAAFDVGFVCLCQFLSNY
jgi:hypothetical protein